LRFDSEELDDLLLRLEESILDLKIDWSNRTIVEDTKDAIREFVYKVATTPVNK
jgi:hypothetical protein